MLTVATGSPEDDGRAVDFIEAVAGLGPMLPLRLRSIPVIVPTSGLRTQSPFLAERDRSIVSKLYFPALGAELIVFTQEQTVYECTNVQVPFKGCTMLLWKYLDRIVVCHLCCNAGATRHGSGSQMLRSTASLCRTRTAV